jgi:hypothetical protein
MIKRKEKPTVIYPVLGSSADLWFMRVAGHGLGNCFYTYFHAVALAEGCGAVVVAPPWFSLKIGPLLRGERSKRFYWRMFRPFDGEIHGVRKLLTLLWSYRKRVIVKVGESTPPTVVSGTLNFIVSSRFTFRGLHAHRSIIRSRLLGTVNDPVPANHRWGAGGYIAIHVRLGDFAEAATHSLVNNAAPNLRIPMMWYVNLTRALLQHYRDKLIYIFSDGDEEMLRPILELGATLYRTGSDMTDLLAMAGASILVGSNSTYSRWAAFLGNMPSIWLKTAADVEKPTAPETPVLYVALDCVEPVFWE